MRFGLSFLPDLTPATSSATDYFDACFKLAVLAEQGGLDSVKMTEHYLDPYGGYCPSPLGFLVGVAARTSRLRLITGGVLPVFRHPIQLASEAAMVDALSGGRLEVGFARAYMPYEFDAFGIALDEGRARFVAAVEAITRLWTESEVTIESSYFTFRHATVLPRPVQQPHPPVWIAASLSPESCAWIGRKGHGLMATNLLASPGFLAELIAVYRTACRRTHGAGRDRLALSIPLYVAESDEQAFREGEHYLGQYLDVWGRAAAAWRGRSSASYPGYEHMADVIDTAAPDRLRREGNVVFGAPDRVADRIESLRERYGVDEILWQVDFGAMPYEESSRSLRCFIERVLPRVRWTARCPGRMAPPNAAPPRESTPATQPARAEQPARAALSTLLVLTVLPVFLTRALGMGAAASGVTPDTATLSPAYVSFATYAVANCVVLACVFRLAGRARLRALGLRFTWTAGRVGGALVAFVTGLAVYQGVAVFAAAVGLPEVAGMDYPAPGPVELALLLALVVVTAPVSEEILFRVLWIGGLRSRMPAWAAAALSIVVFAAIHYPYFGAGGALFISVWALLPSGLFIKYGDVTAPLLMHVLNNFFAYIIVPSYLR